MCKDAIEETQVKENREGSGRTGWKHPDHIRPKEVLGKALGSPVPSEQSHVPRSRSVSIFAAFKPCLERLVGRLASDS